MKMNRIVQQSKVIKICVFLFKGVNLFIVLALLFLNIILPVQASLIFPTSDNLNKLLMESSIWTEENKIKDNKLQEYSLLIQEKNYQAVIEKIKKIEVHNSLNLSQCYLLSIANVGLQQWQEAYDIANKCITINNKWPVIYSLKGTILLTLGEHVAALQQYDKVISLNPMLAGGYLQRAKFYFANQENDRNSLQKALNDLKRYKQLGGDESATYGLQGMIYIKLNQVVAAKKHLNKAIELDPSNLSLLEKLLTLYYQKKEFSQAQVLLDKSSLSISPEDFHSISQVKLIHAKHALLINDVRNAETYFKASLAAQPSNITALKEFIYWLDKQERLPETVALSKQGLQYSPEDKYFTSYIAWALADEGKDLWQAKRWLEKAKKLGPDNVYLSDTQAWISARQGKYQQAHKDIQPSLTYANQVPEIAYHAGVIFFNLGRKPEAIKYLYLSLQSSSSFTGKTHAIELLAKLAQK